MNCPGIKKCHWKTEADRPSFAGSLDIISFAWTAASQPEVPAPTTAASCSSAGAAVGRNGSGGKASGEKCARATKPGSMTGIPEGPGAGGLGCWRCGSFGRTSVGVCGRKLRVQTAAARQRGWWDSRSRSSVGIGAAWTRDEEVGCGQVQGPHHPLGPVLCRGPHLAVPHQRQHNNNNLAHAACLELSDEISDMSD